MTTDENDLAAEAYAQDLYDRLLKEAMQAAREIARVASDRFSDRDPAVTVAAEWGTDGPDEPAIMFVVRLTIAEDFDPDDWPGELVSDVTTSIRERAVATLPDAVPFYVVVGQRAPTQAA